MHHTRGSAPFIPLADPVEALRKKKLRQIPDTP